MIRIIKFFDLYFIYMFSNRSTLVKSLNLFQNNGNPGEVVYGRYVQDLPSKKIAEVENNAQSAYCLPAGCLLDVYKLMKKKDEDDDSQETIIKSKFFKRIYRDIETSQNDNHFYNILGALEK